MDLNAKIEARRRERIEEAQRYERLAKEKEEAERKVAREKKESERREVWKEASRRLESYGITAASEIREAEVQLEFEKIIDKAASERITTREKTTTTILAALGFVMLFASWPIGITLLVSAFLYHSRKIKSHRNNLISEGEKRMEEEQNTPFTSPPTNPPVGNLQKDENLESTPKGLRIETASKTSNKDYFFKGKFYNTKEEFQFAKISWAFHQEYFQKKLSTAQINAINHAIQGHPDAQYKLGHLYKYGRTKDYSEAFKWFSEAAKQGNADAQNALGSMYEKGETVDKSHERALEWYRLAAAQGFIDAQDSIERLVSHQNASHGAVNSAT